MTRPQSNSAWDGPPLAVSLMKSVLCELPVLFKYGLVAVTLLVCGTCREVTSDEQTRSGTTADHTKGKRKDQVEDVYLAPLIPGLGVPIAFWRDEWPHFDDVLICHEPGTPFGGGEPNAPSDLDPIRPFPPNLAIWKDGTILWSQPLNAKEPEHYESRLSRKAVQRLLASIDANKYRTPENMRYSEQVLEWGLPVSSMIAALDNGRSFIFRSQLDQMELIKEYWYWDDGKNKKYPFAEYSFKRFSGEVPKSYGQYLRDYADLRSLLRSVIPKDGKRIDLNRRIRWVVLPVPE